MAYIDQSSDFGYGAQLTSVQMQNLRDNLAAAFNKDDGAPVLANWYVTSMMVTSHSIGAQHLAAYSVNGEKIGIHAIEANHIGTNTISSWHINASAVTEAKIAAAAVAQAKLKTSTGEVSVTHTVSGYATANRLLPGGEYGFYPQTKIEQTGGGGGLGLYGLAQLLNSQTESCGHVDNYVTTAWLRIGGTATASKTIWMQQRYVTSSGEVYWIFFLRNKYSKAIVSSWASPDHPCFGNTNDPEKINHPFPEFNPDVHEIVVINPTTEEVKAIEDMREYKNGYAQKGFIETALKYYTIEESSTARWPAKKVTVGLNQEKTAPIKMKIPKPKNITLGRLKKRA
jgi:hypothetical protein